MLADGYMKSRIAGRYLLCHLLTKLAREPGINAIRGFNLPQSAGVLTEPAPNYSSKPKAGSINQIRNRFHQI